MNILQLSNPCIPNNNRVKAITAHMRSYYIEKYLHSLSLAQRLAPSNLNTFL